MLALFFVFLSMLLHICSNDDIVNADVKGFPMREESCVVKRGLVQKSFTFQDLINHHDSLCPSQPRLFSGRTLTFTTPWNKHGELWSSQHAHKFDTISPCWFQLEWSTRFYYFSGKEHIDKSWIKDVRHGGRNLTKIVPRMSIGQSWDAPKVVKLMQSKDEQKIFIGVVIQLCKENNFDGIAVELTPIFNMGRRIQHGKKLLNVFLKRFAKRMQRYDLLFLTVLFPRHVPMLDNATLASISGFPLMTYDYSLHIGGGKPSPNAPLQWVRNHLEKIQQSVSEDVWNKFYLGLNFYGYEYPSTGGNRVVVNNNILQYAMKFGETRWFWDNVTGEHSVKIQNRTIFFPSLLSVRLRIELAAYFGIGLSVWELGQGFEYFVDMF